jgi:hypothetical protein
LRQVGLEGLSAELVDEVTDVELGLPEEGVFVGGDEGPCDGEEFFLGGLSEDLEELLGLGFALGGRGVRDMGGPPWLEGFLSAGATPAFVYKDSTDFQAAYPPEGNSLPFRWADGGRRGTIF